MRFCLLSALPAMLKEMILQYVYNTWQGKQSETIIVHIVDATSFKNLILQLYIFLVAKVLTRGRYWLHITTRRSIHPKYSTRDNTNPSGKVMEELGKSNTPITVRYWRHRSFSNMLMSFCIFCEICKRRRSENRKKLHPGKKICICCT